MQVKSKRILLQECTIVISDVHGNHHLLRELLKKCNYQAGKDTLILLGDLIEKGTNSLKTLRYVMDLAKQAHVEVVMGNCDAIPLQILNGTDLYGLWHYLQHAPWKQRTLLREMADLIDIDLDDPAYLGHFQTIAQAFPEAFAFLASLPHVLESDGYLFAHAALPYEQYPYAENAYEIMKNDRFAMQAVQFHKTFLCGHTPVVNYQDGILSSNPLYDKKRNIISIDGGCGVKKDGQLNACILEQGNWSFCYVDELPKAEIVRSHIAQQQAVHSINWFDRHVVILKEEKLGVWCKHLKTDAAMFLPKDCLYESPEGLCCDDFTNYRMSVQQGDNVSIIRTWNEEVYVKKQGIHGWIPKNVLAGGIKG